jgi:hypothetical protein
MGQNGVHGLLSGDLFVVQYLAKQIEWRAAAASLFRTPCSWLGGCRLDLKGVAC